MSRIWQWVSFLSAVVLTASCHAADPAQREYLRGINAFVQHDYAQSAAALTESIKLCEAERGHKQQLSDSLLFLARVYSEQGRFASAEGVLKRAVTSLEEIGGGNSRSVASALLDLSVCHHKQGEYDQAEPVIRQALAIEEKALPPGDLLIAATVNNLAETEQKLNKPRQAESLFKKAYDRYASNSSVKARQGMVAELNNLAMFYCHQNRANDALQTADKALALCLSDKDLPAEERAHALNTRAAIERMQFNFAAAAVDYEQALAWLHGNRKPAEAALCETIDNYADMMAEQHDFERAEPLYKRAIEHCRRAHGELHPELAERMRDLAEIYRHSGRYAEAQPLFEQVLATDKLAFDEDSPITMSCLNDLSAVYLAQHKYKEAEDVYAQWLPMLTRVLGPEHPHVADALDNWALVAEKANDEKQAASLRERSHAIRARLMQS